VLTAAQSYQTAIGQKDSNGHSRNAATFPLTPHLLSLEITPPAIWRMLTSPLQQRLDILISKGITLSEDPRHDSGVPGSPTA
jgi:hypothetical protein